MNLKRKERVNMKKTSLRSTAGRRRQFSAYGFYTSNYVTVFCCPVDSLDDREYVGGSILIMGNQLPSQAQKNMKIVLF